MVGSVDMLEIFARFVGKFNGNWQIGVRGAPLGPLASGRHLTKKTTRFLLEKYPDINVDYKLWD